MWVLMLASLLATDPGQEVKLGVDAYQKGQYSTAASHFSNALRVDPGFLTARIYLGISYAAQFKPGSDAPENLRLADEALAEFQQVLTIDPENDDAISSIANLYYSRKNWEEARDWYYKLTEVDPDDKEPFYTLGVIAWMESSGGQMGSHPERKARYLEMVTDGIGNLQRALEIDPEYDDAMSYLSLLLRERAGMEESKEERDRDIAAAENWVHKSLEIKKRKRERAPARP